MIESIYSKKTEPGHSIGFTISYSNFDRDNWWHEYYGSKGWLRHYCLPVSDDASQPLVDRDFKCPQCCARISQLDRFILQMEYGIKVEDFIYQGEKHEENELSE